NARGGGTPPYSGRWAMGGGRWATAPRLEVRIWLVLTRPQLGTSRLTGRDFGSTSDVSDHTSDTRPPDSGSALSPIAQPPPPIAPPPPPHPPIAHRPSPIQRPSPISLPHCPDHDRHYQVRPERQPQQPQRLDDLVLHRLWCNAQPLGDRGIGQVGVATEKK